MRRGVRSDAMGLGFDPEALQREVQMEVAEAMEEVSKANALIAGHRRMGHIPPMPVNRGVARPGGTTVNQFNIVGGTIGQASIGNVGKTVFNQQKHVYQTGAYNANYDITGGNFSQANIGGTAVFNNKDSKVLAGSGESGGGGVTAEDLTIAILEKGVTKDEFIRLLDINYSLPNLAFSLPDDPRKKNSFVNALLNA